MSYPDKSVDGIAAIFASTCSDVSYELKSTIPGVADTQYLPPGSPLGPEGS